MLEIGQEVPEFSLHDSARKMVTCSEHKGKKVTEILEKEPGYFGWLQSADFPLYTKKVLTSIKLRSFNNKLQ